MEFRKYIGTLRNSALCILMLSLTSIANGQSLIANWQNIQPSLPQAPASTDPADHTEDQYGCHAYLLKTGVDIYNLAFTTHKGAVETRTEQQQRTREVHKTRQVQRTRTVYAPQWWWWFGMGWFSWKETYTATEPYTVTETWTEQVEVETVIHKNCEQDYMDAIDSFIDDLSSRGQYTLLIESDDLVGSITATFDGVMATHQQGSLAYQMLQFTPDQNSTQWYDQINVDALSDDSTYENWVQVTAIKVYPMISEEDKQEETEVIGQTENYQRIRIDNNKHQLLFQEDLAKSNLPLAVLNQASSTNEVVVINNLRGVLEADLPQWLQLEFLQEAGYSSWSEVPDATLDLPMETTAIDMDATHTVSLVNGIKSGICSKKWKHKQRDFSYTINSNKNHSHTYNQGDATAGIETLFDGDGSLKGTVYYKLKKRCGFYYKAAFKHADIDVDVTIGGKIGVEGYAYRRINKKFAEQTLTLWDYELNFWASIFQFELELDSKIDLGISLDVELQAAFASEHDIDGYAHISFHCTRKGCDTTRDDVNLEFELNEQINAQVQVDIKLTPYRDLNFNADLDMYWGVVQLVRAKAGIVFALPVRYFNYRGNMCSDADGDGNNEAVAAWLLDINAEVYSYLKYGFFNSESRIVGLGIDISGWDQHTRNNGWYTEQGFQTEVSIKNIKYKDILEGSSVMEPKLTLPDTMSTNGAMVLDTRSCYPFNSRVTYHIDWGDGTSYTGHGGLIAHQWQNPGDYTVRARLVSDAVGREFVERWTQKTINISDDNEQPYMLAVTAPTEDVAANSSYTIQWAVFGDWDEQSSVSLYYDNDNSGYDGTLIADNLTVETDMSYLGYSIATGRVARSSAGNISYTWDTSVMPEGDYYIYAKIDNGVNEPLYDYGSGKISIARAATSPLFKIRLNDTGIVWGGNYPHYNNSTCTGETIAQQDCSHGRDARAAAGTLNKIGGGAAGFDFTRLNADGSNYTGSGDYNAEPWACVRDNHTGLIWEVKTNDGGIHDKDHTYRWGGKTALVNQQARDDGWGDFYDDWDTLVDGSNNKSLCGLSNWRVPTVNELTSIVNLGVHWNTSLPSTDPIDTDYFPNFTAWRRYWSSSPRHFYACPNCAHIVFFKHGGGASFVANRSSVHVHVRLVAGATPAIATDQPIHPYIPNNTPDSRYALHSDGTVTDTWTGLMWQRCSLGQSWDANSSNCVGNTGFYTWQQALRQGDNNNLAGYSDWRLPNVEELRSLVAYDRHGPAINSTVFFPRTLTGFYRTLYWSSSPGAYYLSSPGRFGNSIVWMVDFQTGYDYHSYRARNRNNYYAVRLVRGGQ